MSDKEDEETLPQDKNINEDVQLGDAGEEKDKNQSTVPAESRLDNKGYTSDELRKAKPPPGHSELEEIPKDDVTDPGGTDCAEGPDGEGSSAATPHSGDEEEEAPAEGEEDAQRPSLKRGPPHSAEKRTLSGPNNEISSSLSSSKKTRFEVDEDVRESKKRVLEEDETTASGAAQKEKKAKKGPSDNNQKEEKKPIEEIWLSDDDDDDEEEEEEEEDDEDDGDSCDQEEEEVGSEESDESDSHEVIVLDSDGEEEMPPKPFNLPKMSELASPVSKAFAARDSSPRDDSTKSPALPHQQDDDAERKRNLNSVEEFNADKAREVERADKFLTAFTDEEESH